MKRITITVAALVAATSLLVACGSDDKSSSDTKATTAKAVSISSPWTRVTAPEAMTGAVYMTITSTDGDVLTDASVPASVAGETQIHETTTSGDSMDDSMGGSGGMKGMKEVGQVDIPAGQSVQFKPGGYHIMLMKLAKPITAGETVPVTLTFQKAGTINVDAVARES
jgi:periplasmic copper chaperone A